MSNLTEEKQVEFSKIYVDFGPTKAQKFLELETDTFKRYVRLCRKNGYLTPNMINLAKISENLTPEEIQRIAKSNRPLASEMVDLDFEGDKFKFLYVTDTHLGSKYTDPELLLEAFEEGKRQGCEAILHSGDVTDGLSNRPDHMYQLTHIGYDAQKQHAIDVFSKTDMPIYMIAGNHDLWYLKSAGGMIVKDICEALPNATYLGEHEGHLMLNGNIDICLWHGEDGASYATSYRLQKVAESLYGGDKPNLMLCGHTHKMGYFMERNIHMISGGSIQYQSKWMKMKRIQAHVGFWIVEVTVNKKGITKVNPTFYPFYE